MEEWKFYDVTPNGNVFNIKFGKPKKLKLVLDKRGKGYYTVNLSINGVTKKYKVHQLVAKKFIPNPENKPHINHINGLTTDNRVENLEWCTPKENTNHAIKTGLITFKSGDSSRNRKLNSIQALEIRAKYIPIKYSCYKLAKEYNVSASLIHLIISNKIWL